MLTFTRWKQIAILAICVLGFLIVLPNFFPRATVEKWPAWFPRKQLSLGLDLRGGAHLLLAMETNDVRKDWLDTLRDDARRRLREAKVGVSAVGISGNAVQVRIAKAEEGDAALKALKEMVQPLGNPLFGTTGQDVEVVKGEATSFTITPSEAGLKQRVINALSAAIETVRRRVDAMGTTEPTIVREGASRILVQVPGLQDTVQLKQLIGKTARLSFHEVHPSLSAAEAKTTRVPPGFRIYAGENKTEADLVLRETPVVRGDELTSANPSFDSRTNEPIIDFGFNNAGARKFGKFTQDHVGRPFAIIH
jgi:protein-export membrane protein SecD